LIGTGVYWNVTAPRPKNKAMTIKISLYVYIYKSKIPPCGILKGIINN